MNDDPKTPPVSDAEAAGLLEMGLSEPGTRPGAGFDAPSASDLAARFPELEIMELLGQGGMGVVYRARQRTLDRVVALKVLPEALSRDPAFAERFTREARALAKLSHPHVVGVYEFGERTGLYYLLMEYVDGVTLRQLMRTGSLNPREALTIVPQICEALQYAHEQGVVHRDVKPENILLDRKGRVRVADFGLAKLADPGPADFTLTGTHQVMGTLHYMAPEQYKTPADVDHRADIFSLGVVFYEMLTGELPVGNFKKPSSEKDLDARVDEIVMRALERERDARYQNAKDVEDDVETVLREPARSGPRCGPPAFMSHMRKRHAARARVRADERPVTAWALWGWWIAIMAAPIGLAIWGIVFSSGMKDGTYVGTAIGATVGLCLGLIALVLGIVAVVRTGRNRDRLRGRGRSILLVTICVFLVPIFTAYFVEDLERSRRYQEKQREWEEATRIRRERAKNQTASIEVTGMSPGSNPGPIRSGVLTLWNEYVTFMRYGGGSPGEALRQKYYANKDVQEFFSDDAWIANERAKNGVYGLGAMGKGHLPAPPWEFEIRQIRVDRWEREATVRVWQKAPSPIHRIDFKVKRDGSRWVFVLEPPEVFPETPDEDK
ncbi:MAG: serine/threonine-protein kinase [Planctomycetota bacterium]|nr:serine/threonine-protein kinase [Planctomycetota bacterium]